MNKKSTYIKMLVLTMFLCTNIAVAETGQEDPLAALDLCMNKNNIESDGEISVKSLLDICEEHIAGFEDDMYVKINDPKLVMAVMKGFRDSSSW